MGCIRNEKLEKRKKEAAGWMNWGRSPAVNKRHGLVSTVMV